MTIRKRLFYLNLLMFVIPLAAVMVVSWICFTIIRVVYFPDRSDGINSEKVSEIQTIIDESVPRILTGSFEGQEEILQKAAGLGYHLWVEKGGEPLFTNMDAREQVYIAEYIHPEKFPADNQTVLYVQNEAVLLVRSVKTDTVPITFVALGNAEYGSLEFGSLVLGFILLMVAIVIIVSLYLAGKMFRSIIVPLDNLYIGAQRVREGNFDEDIQCEGAGELEKVCDAFNEMQHQLKANIEKTEKYEQNRNGMLAGISHDLRTPLTSIKSYVKGLQDEVAQTPEKQREYLEVIYRKSCQMENLINQLFLFSKLETGNLPLQRQWVSIQKYMVTLLDSLEYDLQKHHVQLMFNSTCTGQRVYLDTAQMTRAITNIIDNSIKYNPGRQLHITVSLFEQGDRLHLWLHDDGAGVSDEQLPRLFDSFYRGDEARNNPADGNGLGLAIVKNIILAHGGSVCAEKDSGLKIVIELPLGREE